MKKKGFTLIELLVVIGILALLLPFLGDYLRGRANQELNSSTEIFADTLRTAQLYAQNERDQHSWGVRWIDAHSYTLVSWVTLPGGAAPPTSSLITHETKKLPSSVSFQTSNFLARFRQGRGEGSPLDINLINRNNIIKQVRISAAGIVEVTTP